MNITCAIIDDEPLALELLENYVSRVPFLKLTGKYTSAIEALARIKEDGTQLLFLDIQMPDLNGLEFSRIIDSSTKVVFTTAFSEYAIESYRSQALDYLLKPINFTDFMNAANKALKWFELQKKAESAQKHEESDKIYVRSEHKLIAVALDEIIYIEALKDYVMIYIVGRKTPIYTITTMQSLAQTLPADRFMRIHRSHIIALDKISVLEGDTVIVGNKHLSVSRPYRPALLEYLGKKNREVKTHFNKQYQTYCPKKSLSLPLQQKTWKSCLRLFLQTMNARRY